MGAWPYLTARN
ncbi:hypothetical protein YPPY91_1230, partial [Yersinia pestis PY-91]